MELRHLNTFRAVATGLSFTRAATQLAYVQSAVTSHIKALEDELGVRLFDRPGRRIVLTHAGSQLLDYADKILQLANEATTRICGPDEPAGPVIVSAPEVLCAYRLPEVIRDLHDQHPGIRLLFRANPTGALDSNCDARSQTARSTLPSCSRKTSPLPTRLTLSTSPANPSSSWPPRSTRWLRHRP
jgi:DNA-binding transcriptional LysR family regulator